MTSRIEPERLEVYDELEEVRPLSEERFDRLLDEEDDFSEKDLRPDEREYLNESIIPLANDIDNNGQFHAIQVARVNVQMTVVSGYTRYLACKWNGCKVEIETSSFDTESDIFSHIFTENENRSGVDPYNRARLIAQSVGLWDEENDEFIPPSEAEEQVMSLTDFADKTGWQVQRISKMLNPLRQNKDVRNDFGDELSEQAMDMIRRVADTEEEEYTIAESLHQSDVTSTSDFQSIVDKVKDRYAESDYVHQICRRLDGSNNKEEQNHAPSLHHGKSLVDDDGDVQSKYGRPTEADENNVHGSSIPRRPEDLDNEKNGIDDAKDDNSDEEIESPKTDLQPSPTPSSDTTTQPTSNNKKSHNTSTQDDVDDNGTGSVSNEGSSEPEVDSGYNVQNINLDFFDHEDVYRCLAEDAEKRGTSVDDVLYRVLTEHYNRTERL